MNDAIRRYHENLAQRSPCLLVLDLCHRKSRRTAGAAPPERMPALDEGLRRLRAELLRDEVARQRVQLAIIETGGPRADAEVRQDWADASEWDEVPVLERGSTSHLAQGMRLALQHVEQHKQVLRRYGIACTRPWIVVVSSGAIDEPVAVWEAVGQDGRQAERDKRCVLFPILVDEGEGDVTGLRRLSAAPVARMAPDAFGACLGWLAASLAATSRCVPGEPVPLPPVRDWATLPA
jgi:uncharacterized protein YegL